MEFKQAALLPSLTLAYIGDGVYENIVRRWLVGRGLSRVEELHREAVLRVCAEYQAGFYHALLPQLSGAEADVLRRGRNAASRKPKSGDVQSYHKATAVEALFGAAALSDDPTLLTTLTKRLVEYMEGEGR